MVATEAHQIQRTRAEGYLTEGVFPTAYCLREAANHDSFLGSQIGHNTRVAVHILLSGIITSHEAPHSQFNVSLSFCSLIQSLRHWGG